MAVTGRIIMRLHCNLVLTVVLAVAAVVKSLLVVVVVVVVAVVVVVVLIALGVVIEEGRQGDLANKTILCN